jgi:hypothetical protein
MGPTGKSVSRSYAAALDMLIPEDAPIDDLDKSTETKNKAAERYVAAMKYLTSTVPNSSKSVVDVYVEKQQAWSDAMKEWDQAKQAARGKWSTFHSLVQMINETKTRPRGCSQTQLGDSRDITTSGTRPTSVTYVH